MITNAIIDILSANSAVVTLVGDRIEPNILKQGIVYPAIYVNSNRMEKLNCNKDNGHRLGTIEVGVYGQSSLVVSAVVEAVRAALDDYEGEVTGGAINIRRGQDTGDKYDVEEKQHVKIIEYDAIAQIYA